MSEKGEVFLLLVGIFVSMDLLRKIRIVWYFVLIWWKLFLFFFMKVYYFKLEVFRFVFK